MSYTLRKWYQDLLSKEKGAVQKDWGGKITVCLIFPNHYWVGMSNLGFQIIYQLLNSFPDVVCERAFLPERELLEEHQRTNTPLLSLESQRPLSQFQILAFSLPYENDYLNLLRILHWGRVPLRSGERTPRDPLVVAGGAAPTLNPEPLSPFVDVFLLGEGEATVERFLEAFRRWGDDRRRLLEGLASSEGIYVPSLYEVRYKDDGTIGSFRPLSDNIPSRVRRPWLKELDRLPLSSSLLTPETEFGEMVLLELGRGCPCRCRFCAVCSLYRPFRNRPLTLIEEGIEEGLRKARKIGLVGSALGSHPNFEGICERVIREGGVLSLSSLRADAVTERVARALASGGQRTVSIAPETGSEKLRQMVAKDLTDEEIMEATRILVKEGIVNLRLYFLVGLPGERWQDVEAIPPLLRRIRHVMISTLRKEGGRITVSVNSFVPKAWTPFQWAPYAEVTETQRKMRALSKEIKEIKGCRMIHDLPKWGYLQALLSMGDRRVGNLLLIAWEEGGNWGMAFRRSPLNPDFWVYREKEEREILPFDFIDHGIQKERLWEEYREALGR
ncbi:MAG: radical SAM protein [Deltaproteobacteria bacterium]|nr:MAG: radical SAM protein [Deltaproteobacteria bacterium]